MQSKQTGDSNAKQAKGRCAAWATADTALRHDEEWDGKPNTTGEDGFFGKLNELRKKATAGIIEKMADTRPRDQQT